MSSLSLNAVQETNKLKSNYFKKGVAIALTSGALYGLYTAFITLAMSVGVWEDWYGTNVAMLSVVTVTFALGSLGSGINYCTSAIWGLGIAGFRGKIQDLGRSLKSRPGRTLVIASLVGGPIATSAYVIGLQLAGSIIVPIAALCPAIGAILSRIFYKQKISLRVACGIVVCLIASFLIGLQGVADDAPPMMIVGIAIAFVAALGWGFEGAVAGYATSMIDYEIGIIIRQVTAGVSALFILTPIFLIIGGDVGRTFSLIGQAVTDPSAMPFFIISAFFTLYTFSLWYKGNAMCGTAIGMACNGTFSFFGPFFCWLILGLIVGQDGWALAPIVWFSAVLMVVGILFIAINPLALFKKKGVA
jgi:drug/metabolite transporter (DMT)-like permease